MSSEEFQHFNQKPRRKAEFIRPPNILKAKVGSGGLGEDILNKAQTLLENSSVDFQPLAELYLAALMRSLESAKSALSPDTPHEPHIAAIIYPIMQLKANGGMLHYPLVTRIANRLIQFLEVIDRIDDDVIEIISAYHATIRAIIMGRVTGDGGTYGDELIDALNEACVRYFDKRPQKHRNMDFDYLHRYED